MQLKQIGLLYDNIIEQFDCQERRLELAYKLIK